MNKKPKYYSTAVPAERTLRKIRYLLSDIGADRFATLQDFEKGKVGIQFYWKDCPIELIIDVNAIEERLDALRGAKAQKGPEAAERVAFRLLLNWLENNFEMIRWGIFDVMEAFLPYMVLPSGKTVRELLIKTTPEGIKRLALPEAPND